MLSKRLARSVAQFCQAPRRRCFSAEVVLGVTTGAKRLQPAEFVSHISEITQQPDASKALPKLRPWPELLKRVQKRSPGFTGQEVYQLLTILLAGPNRIAIDFATRKSPTIRDVFLIDLVENLEEGAHELSNVQLAHAIYLIANKSRRVLFPVLRVADPASESFDFSAGFGETEGVSALIEHVKSREWAADDKAVVTLLQGLVKAESQKMYGHEVAIRGCITDTLRYLFDSIDFVNMGTRHLVDCGLSIAQITRACTKRDESNVGVDGGEARECEEGGVASSLSSGDGNVELEKRYCVEFWKTYWRQIVARDSTSDLSGRHWGRIYEAYSNILACEGRKSPETLEKDVSEWFILVRHKAFNQLEKFDTDDAITFLNAVLVCRHVDNHELVIQLLQKIALTPVSSLSSTQMMKVRDIGEAIQNWERLTVAVQFALNVDELSMFNISSSSEI